MTAQLHWRGLGRKVLQYIKESVDNQVPATTFKQQDYQDLPDLWMSRQSSWSWCCQCWDVRLQCILQQKFVRHTARSSMGAVQGQELGGWKASTDAKHSEPSHTACQPDVQKRQNLPRTKAKEPAPRGPEGNGWKLNDNNKLIPVQCLEKPAPRAVLELVRCGCKGACKEKVNCSCHKNRLPCTALCKCTDCGNVNDYSICDEDDM